MNGDPEALLERYRTDFANYESFLQKDPQTAPNPPPQRLQQPSKLQRKQQSHVDANATVLEMNHDNNDDVAKEEAVGRDDVNGQPYEEEADSDQDSGQRPDTTAAPQDCPGDAIFTSPPATTTTTAATANTMDTSTSPAARPPAPHVTAMSATAVARAIAAHGGLEDPLWDPQSSSSRALRQSAAASRRRSSAGQLDEVDQLIEKRLQSAARYRTAASPDAMYIKSQAWALRRRQINDALRREQEDMKLSECTFQPQLGPAAEAETSSNSLQPLEDDGPYAAAGITFTEDPGVAQHLKRQEEARRRRRQAQARLDGVEHPKWTGRITVPHEFKLGGRVAEPIPSLRKPCAPENGEVEPWLAGGYGVAATANRSDNKSASRPRVAFGTVFSPEASSASPIARAPKKAGNDKRSGGSVAAAKRRPNERSVPQNNAQSQKQQQQQKGIEEEDTLSSTDYDRDVQLETSATAVSTVTGTERGAQDSQDLVRRLSEQLAHKDAIILAQMDDLARLHRELEAVKETLQQIASLGTAQR